MPTVALKLWEQQHGKESDQLYCCVMTEAVYLYADVVSHKAILQEALVSPWFLRTEGGLGGMQPV